MIGNIVGSNGLDSVGSGGVTALTNGNYVISSPSWSTNSQTYYSLGAVTWGNANLPASRFLSPLIEPDLEVSTIRLSS
mgnify:CR=1 FL=1